MNLGSPLLGLAAAAAILVAVLLQRRRRSQCLPCSGTRGWSSTSTTLRQRLAALAPLLTLVALLAVAVALAGPRRPERIVVASAPGIDLMLVLDRSSSMALPVQDRGERTARFEVACDVLREFTESRSDDRLGLLAFARHAELLCPMTDDHELLRAILAEQEPVAPRSPEDGTAIGSALAAAARSLDPADPQARVAILLTDGENNVPDILPYEGAWWCRESGIRVYVVSVTAAASGAGAGFDVLQEIALATGGRCFRARSEEELRAIYREIHRREQDVVVQQEEVRTASARDRPLAFASVLLLVLLVLERSWWLRP